MTEEWTSAEIEEMAKAAFRGELIRCPRCEARVKAEPRGRAGRVTEDVRLRCERSGLSADFETSDEAAQRSPWSMVEKKRIVEEYWKQDGSVRCPADRSLLHILTSQEVHPGPAQFKASCPFCGRSLWSPEVDRVSEEATK